MRKAIDWDAVLFGLAGLFILLVIANSLHENKGPTGLAILQSALPSQPSICSPGLACSNGDCPGICSDDASVCLDVSGDQCPASGSGPVTVVLRKDLNGYQGAYDNEIFSDVGSTDSSFVSQSFHTYAFTVAMEGLMYFDLSSLPANAQISEASLQLETSDSMGPSTVRISRLLKPWTHSGATWSCTNDENHDGCISPEVPWSAAGALGGSDSATVADVAMDVGVYTVPLTQTVQGWVADPASNNGLLLRDNTGNNRKTFFGSTVSFGSHRPQLTVTYSVPSTCADDWQCSGWSPCNNGVQTRQCADANDCPSHTSVPELQQVCTSTPTPVPNDTVSPTPPPASTGSGNGMPPKLAVSMQMKGTALECRLVVTPSQALSGLQMKFVAPDSKAYAILPIVQSDGAYIIRKEISQLGNWACQAHVLDARGTSGNADATLVIGDAQRSPQPPETPTPDSLPIQSHSNAVASALSQAQTELARSQEAGVDTREVEVQLQQARQLDAQGESEKALGLVAKSRAALSSLYVKAKSSLSSKSWTIAGVSLLVLLVASAAFIYISKMRPPQPPAADSNAPITLELAAKKPNA